MHSTHFVADRRDLAFVQREYLRTQELTHLPDFAGLDAEAFAMVAEEGYKLAETVFAPLNKSGDAEGCRLEAGQVRTPKGFTEAWKAIREGGWVGINYPEAYGGQGLPLSVSLPVMETLFGANPSLFITLMLTGGAAGLITAFGTEEQKQRFARPMIEATWGGTMCLSEAQAGTAVGDAQTRAEPQSPEQGADGHHLISGTKQWISGGDHDLTPNIVHLVLARIKGAPAGTRGLSLFIVPKYRQGPDGQWNVPNNVVTLRIEHKMGIKASPTCVLSFGEGGACHGWLLGTANTGMSQMFKLMNEARMAIGYQGLGASAAALNNAWAYAHERVQGAAIESAGDPTSPRVAIVAHPDVRHMLMSMKALTEGLRGLIHSMAWHVDLWHHGPAEARGFHQDLVEILTPIVKNAGSDLGFEVTRLGMQVLGGVGYTEEFPLAQALRDAKIASIYEGTNGVQALDLVARKLTQRDGASLAALSKQWAPFEPGKTKTPALAHALNQWNLARETVQGAIKTMGQTAAAQGIAAGVLPASDLCAALGHLGCGFHLLSMALLAETRLAAMGLSAEDRDGAAANEDARFYFNKIQTALFHTAYWLPKARAHAQAVASQDTSALEALL